MTERVKHVEYGINICNVFCDFHTVISAVSQTIQGEVHFVLFFLFFFPVIRFILPIMIKILL